MRKVAVSTAVISSGVEAKKLTQGTQLKCRQGSRFKDVAKYSGPAIDSDEKELCFPIQHVTYRTKQRAKGTDYSVWGKCKDVKGNVEGLMPKAVLATPSAGRQKKISRVTKVRALYFDCATYWNMRALIKELDGAEAEVLEDALREDIARAAATAAAEALDEAKKTRDAADAAVAEVKYKGDKVNPKYLRYQAAKAAQAAVAAKAAEDAEAAAKSFDIIDPAAQAAKVANVANAKAKAVAKVAAKALVEADEKRDATATALDEANKALTEAKENGSDPEVLESLAAKAAEATKAAAEAAKDAAEAAKDAAEAAKDAAEAAKDAEAAKAATAKEEASAEGHG